MIYSDVKNATVGTSETKVGSYSIPGGSKIIGFRAISATGTGFVTKVRFDFPGITTPQTYSPGVAPCLDGTAAGAGSQVNYVPLERVEIPVPGNINSVDVYATCNAASQDVYVQLVWVK
ncbi:hypothetical protein DRO69_10405 [Candidatus Bathyarchaeota archaeon]|nr:MAG: hypothetical protein DRO69_10405 [Candidatus Bathyarchaeota archaeon]